MKNEENRDIFYTYSRIAVILTALLLFLGISMPVVSASPFGGSLADALGDTGRLIEDLISDRNFAFGLTFILFFMLMYAIYAAALQRVAVFKGSGSQPNRQGKVVAFSLGLMTAMGIAYWANFSGREFTERILSVAGWAGAIGFALLVFALAYFNMKQKDKPHWSMVFFTTGLAMITYSVIIGDQGPLSSAMASLGIVLVIVGLIFMLVQAVGKSPASSASSALPDWTSPDRSSSPPDGSPLDQSKPKSSSEKLSRPTPPRDFQAQFNPDGSVKLSWYHNPKEENITAYDLQRIGKKRFSLDKKIDLSSTAQNSTVDRYTREPGREYIYRIWARNIRGKRSKPSEVKLEIVKSSIKGRAVFAFKGRSYPLDRIKAKLEGSVNSVVYTGTDGIFECKGIPIYSASYDIILEDTLGIYDTVTLKGIRCVSRSRNELGDIQMTPVPNPSKIDVFINVVDGESGIPYNGKLQAQGIGSFGVVNNKVIQPDSPGNYKISGIPVGHVVNVALFDPTGCLKAKFDPGNDLHIRDTVQKALPNQIALVSQGSYPLDVTCLTVGRHGSVHPTQGITVKVTNDTIYHKATQVTGSQGVAQFAPFRSMSSYRVAAADLGGKYFPRVPHDPTHGFAVDYTHNQHGHLTFKCDYSTPTPKGISPWKGQGQQVFVSFY